MTNLPTSKKGPDITQTEPPYRLVVKSMGGLSTIMSEIVFDDIEDMVSHIREHQADDDTWYQLVGMDLSWRNFSGMGLEHCIFENCNLSGADFSDTLLEGVSLADCDFTNADFSHSRLFNAVLGNNDFSGATFRKAQIKGSQDKGSDFTGAKFDGADMAMSQFKDTDISECSFPGAEMRDLSFTGVRARDADLTMLEAASNITLNGTNLVGANISSMFRKAASGGTTFDPRVSARQMEALKRIRKIRKPGGPK